MVWYRVAAKFYKRADKLVLAYPISTVPASIPVHIVKMKCVNMEFSFNQMLDYNERIYIANNKLVVNFNG